MTDLLSSGQVVFTRDEAAHALGVTIPGFLKAAARQQQRKALFNPRHGFYVVVPPQYLSWGAPPPNWYVDDLMRHEGHPYYVGLLKAAELHGASHQAVMEFQVVTDKRLPKFRAGRSIVAFFYRKDMAQLAGAIIDHKTDTGKMRVSSPELTAFDLLRYAHAAGNIDSIATVLADLGKKIEPGRLVALAPAFERTVIQRLGYLLDYLKFDALADALHGHLEESHPLPWIELELDRKGKGDVSKDERDARWHVIVRHKPEIDE
ncbi:type IV toxin-antitoxin system AbiEi family antitoxin domain-containing protein [Bradyrhizobium neotropicale]